MVATSATGFRRIPSWASLVILILGAHRLYAQGISTNYPGDAGIQNDPNVVFVEMFEETSLNNVLARWSDSNNTAAMSLVADAPPGSAGTRSLNIDGPSGGGGLYTSLSTPVTDVAYLRWYVKYLSGGDYHHSGGCIGGYNPPTPWPQGTAGIKPTGSDHFTINTEPIWNTDFGFYAYWMGMYPDGAGNYWGNLFDPMPSLVRDTWMCVEVMVKLNNPVTSTNGELAYWVNGTKIQHFGPGFPSVSRNNGIWTIDPNGTPFPGFQWRNDSALNINWIWFLNYIQGASPPGTLRFDHIVLAKSYIGPLSLGGTTPTLSSITVSPSSASVAAGGSIRFSATGRDQFGTPVNPQPTFAWTVSGGGAIDQTGLFTAGGTTGGPFTVTASSGGIQGTASVTVTASGTPTLTINSPPSSSTTSPLVVSGTSSGGTIASVTWTNAATGQSGTASGTTNWTASIPLAAGANAITITVTDSTGATTSQTFTVTYTPGTGSGSGGGHHGGCGATGIELLIVIGLVSARRARRRDRSLH